MRAVRQEGWISRLSTYDRFAVITREAFANFLDRYADGQGSTFEWDHFVIRHYGDNFLEEIRRCVVRLVINELPIHGNTEVAREVLRSWAFLLRSSTNASIEQKPNVATIDMTPAEAVLLDSLLHRYSTSGKLTVENSAEEQCLWNVECLLEKHGDRPVWPSLDDAINGLTPEES